MTIQNFIMYSDFSHAYPRGVNNELLIMHG
jgi:hypothetical protein